MEDFEKQFEKKPSPLRDAAIDSLKNADDPFLYYQTLKYLAALDGYFLMTNADAERLNIKRRLIVESNEEKGK